MVQPGEGTTDSFAQTNVESDREATALMRGEILKDNGTLLHFKSYQTSECSTSFLFRNHYHNP